MTGKDAFDMVMDRLVVAQREKAVLEDRLDKLRVAFNDTETKLAQAIRRAEVAEYKNAPFHVEIAKDAVFDLVRYAQRDPAVTKILAIKAIRELTRCGFVEAKAIIEQERVIQAILSPFVVTVPKAPTPVVLDELGQ